MRITSAVQTSLDLAGSSKDSHLGIFNCLPWPVQYVGIVAGDFQMELRKVSASRFLKKLYGSAIAKQGIESLYSPGTQCCQDSIRSVGKGRKRVIEKNLQVPSQFPHQMAIGHTFNWEPNWRYYFERTNSLSIS